MRDRAIKIRNALDNQIRNFSRIEYIVPEMWNKERKNWNKKIKELERDMKKLIRNNDYQIWKWLKNIKGISFVTGAKLISFIDIENTPSVSSLWRYCGLDATHVKRKRGISLKESKKYGSPYLKKELMGVLAKSFIMQKTPKYRKIYDKIKAQEQKRTDENKPKNKIHIELRSKRRMIKEFLKDLWINWERLKVGASSEVKPIIKMLHFQPFKR